MKYSNLIEALGRSPDRELVFEFEGGRIRRDYHITEVVSAAVQAIDCGGKVDQWSENVLQLIEPRHEDGERYMEGRKALSILLKSAEKIFLSSEARFVLEYKPEGSSAAQRYVVSEIVEQEGQLIIRSEGATTQCKAKARSGVPGGKGACCGPSTGGDSSGSACCG